MGRRLSQITLANPRIAARIVDQLALDQGETVVEFGAGGGILTEVICRHGVRVVAVEIDRDQCRRLKARLPRVWVICQDLLRFRLEPLVRVLDNRPKLVANLPYHISGPSLIHIASQAAFWSKAVLTVQREVAQRLVASAGTRVYGRLTVMVGYRVQARMLFHIGPGSFTPRPKVHSAVVEFLPRPRPMVPEVLLGAYRTVVRDVFAHRRKMVRNTRVGRAVAGRGLDHMLRSRPEELSIEDFVALAKVYRLQTVSGASSEAGR